MRENGWRIDDGIAALADITGTTNYPPSGLTRQGAVLSGVLRSRVASSSPTPVQAGL